MTRFLVLQGPRADAVAAGHDDTLSAIFPRRERLGNLLLFASEDTPVMMLPAIDGWILGHVFTSDGRTPVEDMPRAQQMAIGSTRGRHLLDRHAGAYVAFWQDRAGSDSGSVMRDPSAAATAYYFGGDGWNGFASDIGLVSEIGLLAVRPDFIRLSHFLRFPQLPARETCLDSISEILPGERLHWDGSRLDRVQMWSPSSFCSHSLAASLADATVSALAQTIDDVVAGWTQCFDPLLLELSGGLDSSVVAAALAKAGAGWSSLTIATHAADGDERAYARLVAEATGSRLVERHMDHRDSDPLGSPTRLSARPGGMGIQRGFDRMVVRHLDESGAQAIISGTGGDNVFCLLASSAPVLDAWQVGGWRLASATATALATVSGTTIADVWRHVGRRWLSNLYRSRRWMPEDLFLSADVRPRPFAHPWLDLPRRALHGSWGHIAGILRAHPVLDAHDRANDRRMIFPLLAQPVLEACLAIPSWHWIEGGRDRALVRNAYADRLPEAVLSRRRKGHLTTTFARAYDDNRRKLREHLCDGLLAQAGLLDRNAIAAFLAHPVRALSPDWCRIIDLADAELWTRYVEARSSAGIASRR